MAKNYILRRRTQERIDERVERLLNRLGNPEPPLKLEHVRDALNLDRAYFQKDDPSLMDDVISMLRVAGKQVLRRPTLFIDAVKKFDLRAFYLPDEKRILMDKDLHKLKFLQLRRRKLQLKLQYLLSRLLPVKLALIL